MYATTDPYASGPLPDGDLPTAAPVWNLPHRPEAAGIARRLALRALRGWGTAADVADQVVLAVSELVTNAVEHGLPPVALHLERPRGHRTLRIEVTDGGPASHHGAWTTSCEHDEHGRGSVIIDFLATAHGTRLCDGRATHWAELPVAA